MAGKQWQLLARPEPVTSARFASASDSDAVLDAGQCAADAQSCWLVTQSSMSREMILGRREEWRASGSLKLEASCPSRPARAGAVFVAGYGGSQWASSRCNRRGLGCGAAPKLLSSCSQVAPSRLPIACYFPPSCLPGPLLSAKPAASPSWHALDSTTTSISETLIRWTNSGTCGARCSIGLAAQ